MQSVRSAADESPGWPGLRQDADDPADVADAATQVTVDRRRRPALVRVFNHQLRAAIPSDRDPDTYGSNTVTDRLKDVVLSMLTAVWAGDVLDQQAVRELLAAFGVREQVPLELLEAFADTLSQMSLAQAQKNLQTAGMEDLLQARRSMHTALQLVAQFHDGLDKDLQNLLGSQGMPMLLMIFLAPNLLPLSEVGDRFEGRTE